MTISHKTPAKTCKIDKLTTRDIARKKFANLIWKTFPADSAHECAIKCSQAIGASPRTVEMWLNCEASCRLEDVFAVVAFAGIFNAASVFTDGRSQSEIMRDISHG